MKKRGICLLPDACYLSELNVPGKPNRTNIGECAAIQRFLSTHPNENLAILTPYRNQRALLAGTAKKSGYPQEVSLTAHRALGREWDTMLFSVVDTTGKFYNRLEPAKLWHTDHQYCCKSGEKSPDSGLRLQ